MTEQILEINKENEIGLVKISRIVALISLIIGTLILIVFFFSENTFLMLFGLFYLTLMIIINSIFLISLFVKLALKGSDKKQILISIGILLTNIPIVIIYYNLAQPLIGTIMD